MQTLTFHIPQMNCDHCVHKITKFVQDLQGVTTVECFLETKEVKVSFQSPANQEQIIEAIEDCGFEVGSTV